MYPMAKPMVLEGNELETVNLRYVFLRATAVMISYIGGPSGDRSSCLLCGT